jgi:GDP-fucose transporter C1
MLQITASSERLKVAGVVSFYMFAALTMVFVNKAVLNSTPDLPLFFLLLQMLIAVALLHVSAAVWNNSIKIPAWNMDIARKLVPVVAVNIIGLVFNTLCLREVEASFFQIARGLVLPLTIVVSSIHTRVSPSRKVLLAAAVVTFGFMLGVAPSSNVLLPASSVPSPLSLFYGVLSSVFIALHAVLIKKSLPYCNNSTIELAWWTNAGSAAMVFPFVLLNGELSTLRILSQSDEWKWSVFLWGTVITGLFGFLLCVAGLLSIKVTSPITHMFSSAARTVLQTALGVWIFGDVLTINRTVSIAVISGGTLLFTWIKSIESTPAYTAVPQRREEDIELGGQRSEAQVKTESSASSVWATAKEQEEFDEKRG